MHSEIDRIKGINVRMSYTSIERESDRKRKREKNREREGVCV